MQLVEQLELGLELVGLDEQPVLELVLVVAAVLEQLLGLEQLLVVGAVVGQLHAVERYQQRMPELVDGLQRGHEDAPQGAERVVDAIVEAT